MAKEKKIKEPKEKKVKEPKVKKVKEPKDNTKNAERLENIKTSFNLYKFILKIIASVLLLAFGILILCDKKQSYQNSIFVIMLVAGGLALVLGVLGLILLLKKRKNESSKILAIVETAVLCSLGVYLIVAASLYMAYGVTSDKKTLNEFNKFNSNYFLFFVLAIFYFKSICYFMYTIIHKEPTGKFIFYFNIALNAGALICASIAKDTNAERLVILLAVLSLVCAIVIGGEAGGGFFMYKKSLEEPIKETKQEKIEDTNPAKDDDKEIIIPHDENSGDSAIIS